LGIIDLILLFYYSFFVFAAFLAKAAATRSVLPANQAYAELCLQLMPLKNILSCRKIRRGRLRTPEFSECAG
jgi:hypothetical protein